MKKIPTALLRDPNNRAKVLMEITPGCEWVFEGYGTATRKWDGTCVMLDEYGSWWARREVKPGKGEPEEFRRSEYDEVTGKTVGWEPMYNSSFAKFHAEALERNIPVGEGTYELIGPKINGNPESLSGFPLEFHMLMKHSESPVIPELTELLMTPKYVAKVVDKISNVWPGWEGVVWHHGDGRMAKLKGRDL